MASIKQHLHQGYAQTMELKGALLADEKSQYQHIKIFDTVANGRVMTLHGVVQISTREPVPPSGVFFWGHPFLRRRIHKRPTYSWTAAVLRPSDSTSQVKSWRRQRSGRQ